MMGSEHQHEHNCGHSHHHHHHHHGHGVIKNLWLAFFLNFGFAIIELIGGLWVNSVAVLSDALHDMGDSLALLFAIIMEKVSRRQSDSKYSYGYRRYSTLSAFITGIILILGSVFILVKAVPRLLNPVQPNVEGMIFLALLGLGVNGYAAFRVSKGHSLNEKMITWHLLEDVMGWALVLISALVMKFWSIPQLDSALACILAIWIMYNVFRNLNQTLSVFLQAHPQGLETEKFLSEIRALQGVVDIHHPHFWSLDGEKHIFTTHLVLQDNVNHQEIDSIKIKVKEIARSHNIFESTIEIEFSSSLCNDPIHV